MDKERAQIKARLLNILMFVDDENRQKEIVNLLEEAEAKIPDWGLIDWIQKKKRKGLNYYQLCEHLVDDLVDTKLDETKRKVIGELLENLTNLVADAPKNWWEQFVEWFKNGTGIK